MNYRRGNWWYVLIILLIIIFCVLIIPTLFVQQTQEASERKKRDLASLRTKLKKIEGIIEATKERKRELDSRFRIQYLIARIIIAVIWTIGQIFFFVCHGWSEGLSKALEFNGYCLSVLIAANFVLYGKITDVEQLTERFEMWLLNRIYRKDKDIHVNLLAYDDEKKEIISKIEMLKRDILEMEKTEQK